MASTPMEEAFDLCLGDPYVASSQSKYQRYNVPVDHEHDDRGTRIKLGSFQRPHMRGLHCAWISFFLAFCIWFAPAPLLAEIKDDLGLSKEQVWASSITSDATAIVLRIVMGPICDAYGARLPMAAVLVLGSIPTAMLGLVNGAIGLAVVRLFIGIAGSSFVMSQYWPSRLFSKEISGTANGLVGGWGNLGGAVTQLLMGRILFPLFRDIFDSGEKAWRTICIFPAAVAFCWGCILPFVSDDAPMGDYREMKKTGVMQPVSMTTSLRSAACVNTWILCVQYACSFGVEVAMNNAAVLYYTSEFGQSTEDAATLGFIYGSMNIFARLLGGLFSDRLNLRIGMRGRLWLQIFLLISEGLMILVFAFTETLARAIVVMCIFSIFTQAAEGAIYGVVPYVNKQYTGSVAGMVGSGGNVGSLIFGLGFLMLPYRDAFVLVGCIVIASSVLNFFVEIPSHAALVTGEDSFAVVQARDRFILRRQLEQQAQQMATAGQNNRHNQDGSSQDHDDEMEIRRPPKGRGGGGETVASKSRNSATEKVDEEVSSWDTGANLPPRSKRSESTPPDEFMEDEL